MSDPALLDRLRSRIGAQGQLEVARDPVNQPMIRHWCDAMEDHNPVYTEPDYAGGSPHRGIVAPPAMLNAWTMPGLPGRPQMGQDPAGACYRDLDAAGYTSVVATNSEHEYARYLRLGDLVHSRGEVEEVSEEKKTALGIGHFVTTVTEYENQDGEPLGRMRFRILKFQPGTGAIAVDNDAEKPQRELPEASARSQETRAAADVSVGDELPPCTVPITPTLIVATAIASRDYQDVHHDRDLAIMRGSKDIFMNILTSSGLSARWVTDWAGPTARLQNLRIRLGAPNYPGDAMVMRGRVTALAGSVVSVEFAGMNELGPHVMGTIEVALA
jgi:acyl dehydratase